MKCSKSLDEPEKSRTNLARSHDSSIKILTHILRIVSFLGLSQSFLFPVNLACELLSVFLISAAQEGLVGLDWRAQRGVTWVNPPLVTHRPIPLFRILHAVQSNLPKPSSRGGAWLALRQTNKRHITCNLSVNLEPCISGSKEYQGAQ
jgi:hypothetical protein